jgi:hypothetical protein
VTALALVVVTVSLAVLLAVLFHLAWPPVLVSVVGTLPALYLAWLAVPGAISQKEPAYGRRAAGIPARTVLWLGELRQYADADGGADVLGRLADLIVGEGRLLITTVWPERWTIYTAAARAGPGADPAGVAGRLLTRLPELTGHDPTRIDPARGGVIDVPARFTAAEMTSAAPPVTQRWRLRPWRPPAPSRTGKSPSTWPGSLTCWTAMPGAAVTRTARRSSPRRWSERPQPAWRAIRKPTTA